MSDKIGYVALDKLNKGDAVVIDLSTGCVRLAEKPYYGPLYNPRAMYESVREPDKDNIFKTIFKRVFK